MHTIKDLLKAERQLRKDTFSQLGKLTNHDVMTKHDLLNRLWNTVFTNMTLNELSVVEQQIVNVKSQYLS